MSSGPQPNSAPPEQERTQTQNEGGSILVCQSGGAALEEGKRVPVLSSVRTPVLYGGRE
jgi:hypothetical protein